ncbi:EscU/YscU/HrcU family type III secretion system export apparatus switch protein [Nitratireductor sp. ZSWI3]|uniref:EscU/YscU/HrcU family type III secretion system export apparatus switch protein n=1 Tax=Nitratireductor sp. ZSWI3 TaxID=2966359 RepID=UPI00214FD71F|nr:EscU/YscU/HrcU family type III secretion system export apparatus switch protein [Nitratireductor sp. ZSWI3]MCR4264828.1 EscU/YscU/HrcU family type III secretion system export apparatus switch protein [Nitratireductor sp. ZSWI3]
MPQETEEKKLPASDKKLRDARKKGQVSQSRDLVSGFALLAALAYLFVFWPTIVERLLELVQTVAQSGATPFTAVSETAIRQAALTVLLSTAPLVAVIVAVTILFGIIAIRGPVFSFEPIKPQFDHINPGKGFKRLASMRNMVEFAKSLIKTVGLAALFVVVLLAWFQPLFDAPGCGESCIMPMVVSALTPLGMAAALAFVVIGVIDVPIQRWLYRQDLRMTKTELKREQKDLEGDPLLRQERRRQRRDAASRPTKLGMRNAVLAFRDGDRLVGLRYVRGETPVPVIVAKGQGRFAAALVSEARQIGCPVIDDRDLVQQMYERARVGEYLDSNLFQPVISHLVRLGIV